MAPSQLDAAFPPSTTMVRFRTRYFNRFVERGIEDGARQVVLLGSGFDTRAHHYRNAGAACFEVDQKTVLEFKHHILSRRTGSNSRRRSSRTTWRRTFRATWPTSASTRRRRTLMIWEGNTMYLLPESIMPFLNRLAGARSSLRIAFDYFSVDLQRREFDTNEDLKRLEGGGAGDERLVPRGLPGPDRV